MPINETRKFNTDMLNYDECIVINNYYHSTVPSEFTKEWLLKSLTFNQSICDDTDVLELLKGLEAKIIPITDSEWEDLKMKVPFYVPYSGEDEYMEIAPRIDENGNYSTQEEIKIAYRQLAKKYHPDINKDANATTLLKMINEAYTVLSDPQKRAAYDRRQQTPKNENKANEEKTQAEQEKEQ